VGGRALSEDVFDAVRECISVHDGDMRIVRANRALSRFLGLPPEQIIGRRCHELFHHSDTPIPGCPHLATMRTGATGTCECQDARTGTPLLVSTSPILDGDGTVVGSVHVAHDVSSLKRTEQELRESEERFRTVFDNANDGILLLDEQGTILELNELSAERLGYTRDELRGTSVREIDDPAFAPFVRDRVTQVLRDGSGVFCSAHRRRDGSSLPVEISARTVQLGGRRQILSVVRDVTEHQATEAALRRYAAEVEEANRLKDLFLDILSHDLANSAALIGNVADLIARETPAAADPKIELIRRHATKLLGTIRDASVYARVAQADAFELSGHDLTALLAGVINRLAPRFEERTMTVRFTPAFEAPALVHPLVEHVFENLLANAAKYAPEGSTVAIDIAAEGGDWVVSVADQGSGIPDGAKEEIFERFRRIEKGGVKGSGLGLAIARRIVDIHRGRLWVEDAPGGGAVFRVRLPGG
jgi:PAS domain S-box-containing protein